MLQRLRSRLGREEGFTLIELLVVILIIGILAAIAIPSFLNQTEKGDDAAAKSAARSAQTAQETYYTNERAYANSAEALADVEGSLDFDLITSVTGDDDQFEVVATSDSTTAFTIERIGDVTTYTCSRAGEGGCPESGVWGGEEPADE